MKKNLVIVPTRSRNLKSKEFAQEFFNNSAISDLLFGLDDDDQQTYDRIPGVLYEVNPRMKLNGTLNLLANKYCSKYDYISFMGDDHRIRTKDWDSTICQSIQKTQYSIAYGNDLIQKERLPTAVILDSKIIQKLGFMAPPCLIHLYIDNFWKELGNNLKTLQYFPEIIIEHMHYIKGKSENDAIYQEVNSDETFAKDKAAFKNYMNLSFQIDIGKLI